MVSISVMHAGQRVIQESLNTPLAQNYGAAYAAQDPSRQNLGGTQPTRLRLPRRPGHLQPEQCHVLSRREQTLVKLTCTKAHREADFAACRSSSRASAGMPS